MPCSLNNISQVWLINDFNDILKVLMITLMNSFIINQTAYLLLIKNINEYEIPVSVFNTDDPYFYIAKCILKTSSTLSLFQLFALLGKCFSSSLENTTTSHKLISQEFEISLSNDVASCRNKCHQ